METVAWRGQVYQAFEIHEQTFTLGGINTGQCNVMSSTARDQKYNWASSFRQYLALREPNLLERAIEATQEQSIADLLEAFGREDLQTVDQIGTSVHKLLDSQGRSDEALTVLLPYADLWVRFVKLHTQYPQELQGQVLQEGLKACEAAITVARILGDLPCVAFYQVAKADGLRQARDLDAARTAYETALSIYRDLSGNGPEYMPRMANTLCDLGKLLRKLREFQTAKEMYEEALAIFRVLEQSNPGLYGPITAETLTNFGNVLLGLRQFKEASRQYEEALISVLALWVSRPEQRDAYKPLLATALYHSANVLNELREFEEARERYYQALSLYQELAESQPQSYDLELAVTHSGLGNLLRFLRELLAARKQHESALRIYRDLASRHPKAYEPELARALGNYGVLLVDLEDIVNAREHYEEALRIYRTLNESRPTVWHVRMDDLTLSRTLRDDSQRVYEPDLAMILTNLVRL